MRSPYNGKPYYCDKCGAGFGEYMACEMPDCTLETEQIAQDRREQRLIESLEADLLNN